jgi:omega-6 fatty acid desaturase (delta-12 desaturase)
MHDPTDLRSAVKPFEKPILAASLFQLVSSIALFVGACALMYWSLQLSYLVTLLLAVPAGALLVRVFIIQHDCGHGSFFASPRLNNWVGMLCSVFTLAPYASWRRQHAGHHAVWNNLDKRYSGSDIYSACLTVGEYQALSRRQRFLYRISRHPIVAHVVLPPLVFLILYRLPFDTPKDWSRERRAVHALNGALLLLIFGLGLAVGFLPVLLVQLPVMIVGAIIGVWLFAVQHRFEDSQWARQRQWSFTGASLEGSSVLKLPRILQWFTGNIGFHNVHHFAPRIPNYRLQRCYEAVAALQEKSALTFRAAMSSLGLALWDEDRQRLVRFKDAAITEDI